MEVTTGFEPVKNGFADRCLRPLGHVTTIQGELYRILQGKFHAAATISYFIFPTITRVLTKLSGESDIESMLCLTRNFAISG